MTEINPETIADDFGIKGLTVEGGVSELTTMPTTEQAKALVLEMSLACGRMLDDDQAPNYVEFEVSPAGHPGYIVHVRRAMGQTPHELRRKAETRAERAEAALVRVRELLTIDGRPRRGQIPCAALREALADPENGDIRG